MRCGQEVQINPADAGRRELVALHERERFVVRHDIEGRQCLQQIEDLAAALESAKGKLPDHKRDD